jgi:hypothetical protein
VGGPPPYPNPVELGEGGANPFPFLQPPSPSHWDGLREEGSTPPSSMTMVMNGRGIGRWNEFGGYEHVQNMYETGNYSEIESDGEDVGNATRIKHDYRDETWKRNQFTYDPKPQRFLGVS